MGRMEKDIESNEKREVRKKRKRRERERKKGKNQKEKKRRKEEPPCSVRFNLVATSKLVVFSILLASLPVQM